jgi:8-oxo-dGTP diphosphatase
MMSMSLSDPMDLVRAFYRALNRSDLDAIAAFYHPACVVEQVFTGDAGVYEGREVVRLKWAAELERYAGALENGRRIELGRVAGIETGWGWVRADWRTVVADVGIGPNGERLEATGYSHFWFEDGLIRRQRSVGRTSGADASRTIDRTRPVPAFSSDGRHYPQKPVVGVGAVILGDDGRVVLVKRRHEPLAGQWSLPGGMLELGETLEGGIARELLEETGLVVDVGPVVEVFDRILVDEAGRVRYHFVLVDYLCRPRSGTLEAGTDVEAAEWAAVSALDAYRVASKARDVIARALAIGETQP